MRRSPTQTKVSSKVSYIVQRAISNPGPVILILIIIIHTFLYRRKVLTSEALAEVRSDYVNHCLVIMSQVYQVSFKPQKFCCLKYITHCSTLLL